MTNDEKRLASLKHKISVLPNKPGIYQFFSKYNVIIYVGKAKDLKKRVSSYFLKNVENHKTRLLVKQIYDIKHIVVDSETDALLLENNFIKKYQPKYNVLLKDDKSFPWICIKNEPFPRVFSTRNVIKDGSLYYGPYTSTKMVHTLLELIREIYPLRTCNYYLSDENIDQGKFKVCLEYHIGKCKAPCVGLQTKYEYNDNIEQIKNILRGNIQSVISSLESKMEGYAEVFKFEEAQNLKDTIKLLNKYKSKSTIVSRSIHNVDVFSYLEEGDFVYVNFLKMANGSIIQSQTIELKKKMEESKEELLTYAITHVRQRLDSHSKEIVIPFPVNYDIGDVNVTIPQKGDKKHVLDLSTRNAKYFLQERKMQLAKTDPERHEQRILETAKSDLRLKSYPRHIECFDNSNIQGENPVAACVVFRDTKPSKKEYRKFHIKTVTGPDDYASMYEVVYRRYRRYQDEDSELPDLLVIDGGKGQLNAAVRALKELGIAEKIPVLGIAKRLEEIFFPGDEIPLYLDKNSETLKLIQHLRDEAHRFGITFHRKNRTGHLFDSDLNSIDGIGPKTIEKLFKYFKSKEAIKEATKEQLKNVLDSKKAHRIFSYFNSDDE